MLKSDFGLLGLIYLLKDKFLIIGVEMRIQNPAAALNDIGINFSILLICCQPPFVERKKRSGLPSNLLKLRPSCRSQSLLVETLLPSCTPRWQDLLFFTDFFNLGISYKLRPLAHLALIDLRSTGTCETAVW